MSSRRQGCRQRKHGRAAGSAALLLSCGVRTSELTKPFGPKPSALTVSRICTGGPTRQHARAQLSGRTFARQRAQPAEEEEEETGARSAVTGAVLPITLRRRTMRRKPMCLGAPAIVSGRGGLLVGRRYPSAETRRQRATLYCSIVASGRDISTTLRTCPCCPC
jgi:hypothetical protein